jgi:hypothetical protein
VTLDQLFDLAKPTFTKTLSMVALQDLLDRWQLFQSVLIDSVFVLKPSLFHKYVATTNVVFFDPV